LISQHALSAREAVLDAREKEYVSKRRELDNWNEILAGRDREMARDRKQLDDKLDAANIAEEKQRIKDAQLERLGQELQMKEIDLNALIDKYKHMLADMDQREALNSEQAARLRRLASELSEKEVQLGALQEQLQGKEVRLQGVEAREEELNKRVSAHAAIEEDFYNVKVASISSRHAKELAEMEAIISEQLKVVSNFQTEIERVRAELSDTQQEKEALEAMNNARASLIEKLQLEVSLLDTDRKQLLLVEQDIEKLTKLGSSEYLKPREGEAEARRGGPSSSNPEALTSHILMSQLGATQRLLTKIIDGQNAKRLKSKPPSPFERPLNIKWFDTPKSKEDKRIGKEASKHKSHSSSKSKKSESRRSNSPAASNLGPSREDSQSEAPVEPRLDSERDVIPARVSSSQEPEAGLGDQFKMKGVPSSFPVATDAYEYPSHENHEPIGAQNTSDLSSPDAVDDSDHDEDFIEGQVAPQRVPVSLLRDISARRAPSPLGLGKDSSSIPAPPLPPPPPPPPPDYHSAVHLHLQPPPEYHRVIEMSPVPALPVTPAALITESPPTAFYPQSSGGHFFRQNDVSKVQFDSRQPEPLRHQVDLSHGLMQSTSGPRLVHFSEEPSVPRNGSASVTTAPRPAVGLGRTRPAFPPPLPPPPSLPLPVASPSPNQRNVRLNQESSYSAQYSSPTASSVNRRIDNSRHSSRPVLSRPIPPPIPSTMSSKATGGSPESPPSRLHLVKNNSAGVPVASVNLGLGFKKKLT
jgi:hypothetical protein